MYTHMDPKVTLRNGPGTRKASKILFRKESGIYESRRSVNTMMATVAGLLILYHIEIFLFVEAMACKAPTLVA